MVVVDESPCMAAASKSELKPHSRIFVFRRSPKWFQASKAPLSAAIEDWRDLRVGKLIPSSSVDYGSSVGLEL